VDLQGKTPTGAQDVVIYVWSSSDKNCVPARDAATKRVTTYDAKTTITLGVDVPKGYNALATIDAKPTSSGIVPTPSGDACTPTTWDQLNKGGGGSRSVSQSTKVTVKSF
jgi:hypothetical protein